MNMEKLQTIKDEAFEAGRLRDDYDFAYESLVLENECYETMLDCLEKIKNSMSIYGHTITNKEILEDLI